MQMVSCQGFYVDSTSMLVAVVPGVCQTRFDYLEDFRHTTEVEGSCLVSHIFQSITR